MDWTRFFKTWLKRHQIMQCTRGSTDLKPSNLSDETSRRLLGIHINQATHGPTYTPSIDAQ